MAIQVHRRLTLEEFLALPEEQPALELGPGGVVTQKMSPKSRHSVVQAAICHLVNVRTAETRTAIALPELRVTLAGLSYVPDVSIFRWDQLPRDAAGELLDDVRIAPLVVVEIVSPQQSVVRLVERCTWYVEHGVLLALLVDPTDRSVLAFLPSEVPRAVRGPEPIPWLHVLPEVPITADNLFHWLDAR